MAIAARFACDPVNISMGNCDAKNGKSRSLHYDTSKKYNFLNDDLSGECQPNQVDRTCSVNTNTSCLQLKIVISQLRKLLFLSNRALRA